jgi:uncharacterized protein (TIGR02678 family)
VTPVSKGSYPEIDAERRHAFRALLRNPLLPATGESAAQYKLVQRHVEWLRQWLAKFPAWSLHIDRECARLRKLPADLPDETRPAVDRNSGTTFTRRRYALMCLALASLEKLNRQTPLRQIAQIVTGLIDDDSGLQSAGLVFDIGNYDQRRDLVHALRLLVDSGVLRKLDGDEQQFLAKSDSADVLYDINRRVLAAVLQVPSSASAIQMGERRYESASIAERTARLTDDPPPLTEDRRKQWIRSRLVRSLLDDPIVYFHDLTDEERQYLDKHSSYLLRQIYEATGLIAEVRREGIAMVDDAGDLTDLKLPEDGAVGHLSLLLIRWFTEHSRNVGRSTIPISAIEHHVHDLIQVHANEWRDDVREANAETRLMEDALLRLRALRLIQSTGDGVVPLAACGRYAEVGDSHEE